MSQTQKITEFKRLVEMVSSCSNGVCLAQMMANSIYHMALQLILEEMFMFQIQETIEYKNFPLPESSIQHGDHYATWP
jgi:hypothetical protein